MEWSTAKTSGVKHASLSNILDEAIDKLYEQE